MYRHVANTLGEIFGGVGMAPAGKRGEGSAGEEVGTQTEVPAVNSVGSQVESADIQTVKSIGTQSEAGVVALQTERSSVGTPEGGYESAERNRGDTPESGYESAERSRVGTPESGYENAGSSTRTCKEAVSRAAISHEKDERKNSRL